MCPQWWGYDIHARPGRSIGLKKRRLISTISPVVAGDEVKVTINTTSSISGTATLENLSSSASDGAQVVRTWTDVSPALCFDTAKWAVEDFEVNDVQVPFADFGSVTWTDTAALVDGVSVGASQGLTMQLQSASTGAVVAEGSLEGDDVIITYV